MRIFKIFVFFISVCISNAQTKKNIDNQSILWTRYYNQLTLNNAWSIHTEFDNRVFLKPFEQNLYVFRIQGRCKINERIETGIGYAYFSVSTQDPEITTDFQIPENRGQQDITWKEKIKAITINQRFQVEERFIHNSNNQELIDGTTFFWRFRYRLQGDYIFWKKEDSSLKIIVYDEIMINAGRKIVYNTFDQNRIYTALQCSLNKNIALELGYLKSLQQRNNGTDYFNRDIIRFSIFHKIKI